MAAGALTLMATMSLHAFAVYLGCFLALFAATGIGNGSAYRMIPGIFAARAQAKGIVAGSPEAATLQRRAAAALGIVAAIGAYGGFVVPQILNISHGATGGYQAAFTGFVIAYAALFALTVVVYVIPRASFARQRI